MTDDGKLNELKHMNDITASGHHRCNGIETCRLQRCLFCLSTPPETSPIDEREAERFSIGFPIRIE